MTTALALAAVLDGNGRAVTGSVRCLDESGVGNGPQVPTAAIYTGGGAAGAAEVVLSEEGIASTKYGLLTRVVGLGAWLGALNETAPATDIASSGVNGRLQRIAQNLTSLLPSAAHDAAVAGNPFRLAARALTSNYAAVATGDTADLVATLVGALVTKPFSIPENDWSYAAAASGISDTNTAVTIKAAAGAGLRNYITAIQINSEAFTSAAEVAIRDGAAGTVLWRCKVPTTGWVQPAGFSFASPLRGTANTLLEFLTITASGGGKIYFNAQGFVAP